MLKIPRRPLSASATVFFALSMLFLQISTGLLAQDISRSEAQTPGEKRLLEWDLSKSYDLSRSRTNPKGSSLSRPFATQSFQPGSFNTKAFSTASFSSPEFLTPKGKPQTKSFPSKPALARESSDFTKPFVPGNAAYTPPKVIPTLTSGTSIAPKTFVNGTRLFQGAEAARKEQKYAPGNAPSGGVIEGRRLSVDEVRDILNKSK